MSNQAEPGDPNAPCNPESVGDPYPDPDEDPDSAPPWRPDATFFAWCPASNRLEAFLAALSAFGTSGEIEVFDYYDASVPESARANTIEEATDVLRRLYARRGSARARVDFLAPTGRTLAAHVSVGADSSDSTARIEASLGRWRWPGKCLYEEPIPHPKTRNRPSIEVEAGVEYARWLTDAYEILVRLCTVSPSITVGGCGGHWCLPTTGAGSYHADGYTARDLARTWWHLVHPDSPAQTSGYSLADLRACVEASPHGTSLSPAMGVWLTREQVLAAMDLPKEELLAALEMCAAETSPEWRAIEADINHMVRSLEYAADEDAVEWSYLSHHHIHFLKKHAPSVVKRLDSGAVVLLAYPWRNLWPLWADALRLLGIRP